MTYTDPAEIPYTDTRGWMPWAECADLEEQDPYYAALLWGEASTERVDTQQRQFVERYCSQCVVVTQCGLWADSFQRFAPGCFGGLTEDQRVRARRKTAREKLEVSRG